MSVRWSLRAERDLYEIADYIGRDDPVAAVRWIDRVRDRARRASTFPRSGRRVPEIDVDDIREVFLGNYRIVYVIEGRRAIHGLTIREGHLPVDVDPD